MRKDFVPVSKPKKNWKKICEWCESFYNSKAKRFCSKFCYHEFNKGENSSVWKGDKIAKICKICKNKFRHHNSSKGRGKLTCSPECAIKFLEINRKDKNEKIKTLNEEIRRLQRKVAILR